MNNSFYKTTATDFSVAAFLYLPLFYLNLNFACTADISALIVK